MTGLVVADSFEAYSSSAQAAYRGWSVPSGSITISGTYGRHGQGIRKANGDNSFQLALPGAYTDLIVGFSVYWVAYTTDNYPFLMLLSPNGTHQVDLTARSDGRVQANRNNRTTVLGTSASPVFSLATWHRVEARITISDTTGIVQVKVDDTVVLDLSNQDTQNTDATVGSVRLGTAGSAATHEFYADDLTVVDGTVGTYLGLVRVSYAQPTGAGASTQMTPTGSTNWENVNDATFSASDADYNTASDGELDLYAVSVGSVSAPKVVYAFARARKTGIGYGAATMVLGNGTNEIDAPAAITTLPYDWAASPALVAGVFDTPPTGTWATFNMSTLQVGVRVDT